MVSIEQPGPDRCTVSSLGAGEHNMLKKNCLKKMPKINSLNPSHFILKVQYEQLQACSAV